MPLHEITFNIEYTGETIGKEWSHNGVPGSGDMEVLLRRREAPDVSVRITTPVTGFDDIWKAVVSRAVAAAGIGGVSIEINDNNATPFVAALRLRQGFAEAGKGGCRQ